MKNILLSIILSTICSLVYANEIQTINSTIESVTVHPKNATIQRLVKANITAGYNTLEIINISNNIDVNSLKVLAKSGITITEKSIAKMNNVKENIPLDVTKENKLNQITDYIADTEAELTIVRKKMNYITTVLLGNNFIVENETNAKLNERFSFYEEKYLALREREKKLKAELLNLNNEKNDFGKLNKEATPTISKFANNKIKLIIFSEKPEITDLKINYLVTNVSWKPFYEVHCNNIESDKISIIYKAVIQQNTGEDWNNVSLSFSTNQPNSNYSLPKLKPIYVRHLEGGTTREVSIPGEYSATSKNNNAVRIETIPTYQVPILNEFELSANYTIAEKQSIISNNIEKKYIYLSEKNANVNIKRKVMPQTNNSVYLIAEVEDWQSLNIMTGNANVFFENQQVALVNLKNNISQNILQIPFGKDNNITVNRVQLETSGKTKFLENAGFTDYNYLTTISNNSNKVVKIELMEQIPLAKQTGIEVTLNNTDYLNYDEALGYVTWQYNIKSKKSEDNKLSYTVKHDKKKPIIISR